jgi:hypothetical protein
MEGGAKRGEECPEMRAGGRGKEDLILHVTGLPRSALMRGDGPVLMISMRRMDSMMSLHRANREDRRPLLVPSLRAGAFSPEHVATPSLLRGRFAHAVVREVM